MKILALGPPPPHYSRWRWCEMRLWCPLLPEQCGLTHSTLMPMARILLDNCGTALDAVELIAVAAGPAFIPPAHRRRRRQGAGLAGEQALRGLLTQVHGLVSGPHGQGICAVMDARRNR